MATDYPWLCRLWPHNRLTTRNKKLGGLKLQPRVGFTSITPAGNSNVYLTLCQVSPSRHNTVQACLVTEELFRPCFRDCFPGGQQGKLLEQQSESREPALSPGADGHQAPQGLSVRQATESWADFLHGLQIIRFSQAADRKLSCFVFSGLYTKHNGNKGLLLENIINIEWVQWMTRSTRLSESLVGLDKLPIGSFKKMSTCHYFVLVRTSCPHIFSLNACFDLHRDVPCTHLNLRYWNPTVRCLVVHQLNPFERIRWKKDQTYRFNYQSQNFLTTCKWSSMENQTSPPLTVAWQVVWHLTFCATTKPWQVI